MTDQPMIQRAHEKRNDSSWARGYDCCRISSTRRTAGRHVLATEINHLKPCLRISLLGVANLDRPPNKEGPANLISG